MQKNMPKKLLNTVDLARFLTSTYFKGSSCFILILGWLEEVLMLIFAAKFHALSCLCMDHCLSLLAFQCHCSLFRVPRRLVPFCDVIRLLNRENGGNI